MRGQRVTDDQVKEFVSKKLLKSIPDAAVETIFRRVLFYNKNKIDWQDFYENICEQMPECDRMGYFESKEDVKGIVDKILEGNSIKSAVIESSSDLAKKALNTVRSEAKKFMKNWHDNSVDFDIILKDHGYRLVPRGSMYEYYKPVQNYSADGINKVFVVIDFYHLIIGDGPNYVRVYVVEHYDDLNSKLTDVKNVEDIY